MLRGIRSARREYIWLLKLVWHRPSFSHQSDMERGSNVGRLNFPDSRLIKNSDQLRPPRRCLGFAVNVTLDPSNRRQERKDRAVPRRGLPGRLRHQSNWFKDHLHTNRLLKFASSCHRAGNTQWVPACPAATARHSEGRNERAITVLDAPGDSEMRFQNQGQIWNRAINDAALAYGYTDYTEATMQFIPTARDCRRKVLARRSNPLRY
jgi:hypothetical protein